MKRNAFTLVEALISLSIIAILAALIVPSIGYLMGAAKSSTSLSNLRQCHLVAIQYANENGGVYVENKDSHNELGIAKLWRMAYPDREFPGYGHDLKGSIFYTPLIEDDPNARTFGLNSHLLLRHPNRRLGVLPYPERIAYMGDTKTSSGYALKQFNPRNNGKVNVIFLDGHVEAQAEADVPTDIFDYYWTALPESLGSP